MKRFIVKVVTKTFYAEYITEIVGEFDSVEDARRMVQELKRNDEVAYFEDLADSDPDLLYEPTDE